MDGPAAIVLKIYGWARTFKPVLAEKTVPDSRWRRPMNAPAANGINQASSPFWTEGKYKKGSRTSVQLIRSTVLIMFKLSSSVFSSLVLSAVAASAYDPAMTIWSSIGVCASRSLSALVFILLGQNSYGATHGSDTPNWQQTISNYCQDTCIDVIPIAFVDSFSGGVPDLNLGNASLFPHGTCDDNGVTGTCASMAAGIQACQDMGKIVTLSLGGGGTTTARFATNTDATNFATTIWNSFLGGSGAHRPFGSVVLDGVDLDIESGTNLGYAAFATQIRSLWSGASKPYYLSAAPQCPFPDAWVGNALDTVWFDSVHIQFYNGLNSYPSSGWNYATDWLPHLFANPNVKLFIGAPASTTAANPGEYVSASTLGSIALASRALNPSPLRRGHALAYANGRFDAQIKNIISARTGCGAGGNSGGDCAQTYTVVSGDTCSGIETTTGVSDSQLHALNPAIDSGCTNLQVGQILCLEAGTGGDPGCTQTYTVVSGDTCSGIEATTGVSDTQLHALNPAIDSGCTNLSVGQILCLSGGGGACTQTYTVVSGDTCSSIETTTGISDTQLHAMNPAIDSGCTNLSVGQTLCV
ncbi:Carbohydrate-binding module family 5 protein [Mycena venus]|uniref:chitinase n=1 Tax=Mycena venus TaxID=2733690 RepID=A0A8H7D0G6_9AGAR|nr:Carbohydrate-binding module family 5 protein [Mycena venus]